MRLLARNYKRQFPELFYDVFSPISFNFKHIEVDGARDSFNSFVDEMFGYNAHLKIDAEPTDETEKLLEVSEKCNKNYLKSH